MRATEILWVDRYMIARYVTVVFLAVLVVLPIPIDVYLRVVLGLGGILVYDWAERGDWRVDETPPWGRDDPS